MIQVLLTQFVAALATNPTDLLDYKPQYDRRFHMYGFQSAVMAYAAEN